MFAGSSPFGLVQVNDRRLSIVFHTTPFLVLCAEYRAFRGENQCQKTDTWDLGT